MYVRIAKFEGAEGNWDERIEEVRKRMRGTSDATAGSAMETARDAVKRSMMLVDREGGRGASMIFCETADDARRVDEAMNQMSPPPGGGSRSSVEIYEVALDEQPA